MRKWSHGVEVETGLGCERRTIVVPTSAKETDDRGKDKEASEIAVATFAEPVSVTSQPALAHCITY